MKDKNMTALISCFVMCYHYKNNKCRVYSDKCSEKILTNEEYENISNNIINGINFFNSEFVGSRDDGLKWIVNNQLAPSVLARSAFCEKSLINSIRIGCKQYLIYASGYDTSIYNLNNYLKNVECFEIDKSSMINDKKKRLLKKNVNLENINYISCDFTNFNWINYVINSKYNSNVISFNSLLGISYYLTKDEFKNMIKNISDIICNGSSIIFDYQSNYISKENSVNMKLAKGAHEDMKSNYSYDEIEKILADNNLYIYEHLNNNEADKRFFDTYNFLINIV